MFKKCLICFLSFLLTFSGYMLNNFPTNKLYAQSMSYISAGSHHSLSLKSDGTVWAWGYNFNGQLGTGNTVEVHAPIQVKNLTNIISVVAGYNHSLAIESNGQVWAWGSGSFGQLGIGVNSDSNIPVKVSNLTGVVAISAAVRHSLALKSDGTVWAWGYNGDGELGSGSNNSSSIPVQVKNLNNVIAISANGYHSLALKSDGTVWGWGSNYAGQLGDGSSINALVPVKTVGLSNVIAISAGETHSMALKSDGNVWTWGSSSYGELGNGSTSANSYTPTQPYNLSSNVIAISAGAYHSTVLKSDGTVWGWGYNGDCELGNGSTSNARYPVQVNSLNNAVALSTGTYHSLILKPDGTVWGWGGNSTGQLGNCTTSPSYIPSKVYNLSDIGAKPLDIPIINNYTSTSNNITLNWGSVSNAIGYDILINGTQQIDAGNNISYTINNLTPNTVYSLQIRSKNSTTTSNWSNSISAYTSPDNAIINSLSATNNSITVNWNSITGASGYDISINDNIVSTNQVTSYTINNLTPNTQYNIKIRSKNSNTVGVWSIISSIYTKISTPSINNFTSNSNSITLNWNNNSAVTDYNILINGAQEIDVGNNNSYTIKNLSSDTSYSLQIRSKNSNTISDWSNPITVYTAPNNTVISNYSSTQNSITLNWNSINNVTDYNILINGTQEIDVGNCNSYTINNLNPNTSYSIQIRSKNNNGISDWNTQITIYTTPNSTDINSLLSTSNSVTVNWNNVDGVSGYDININGKTISVSQITNYTINNLTPNTQYDIKIRSKNTYVLGEWSNVSSIYTKTDIPNINSFSSTSNSITINWNVIDGATSYELSIDNSNPFDIGNITSYTQNGLSANSSHTYTIRSKNSNGTSDLSNPITVYTTAIEPQKVIVNNASDKEIKVSVNGNINPIGTQYNFGAFQNETSIKETGFTTNSTASIEGLNPTETYDIKVATKSINGITSSFTTLGTITVPDKNSTNSDVDVSVIVDPTITLTINTNSISFGNVSPLTASYELPSVLVIGIQSNNVYTLSAKVNNDFIGIKGFKMPSSLLNIKEHNNNYVSLQNGVKNDLVSNQAPTSGTNYNIDLKLNTDWQIKPDNYSNIINIAVNQL